MSPKQKFIGSPHKAAHEAWAASAVGDTACDYALLELAQSFPSIIIDPATAAAAQQQMAGARVFVEILLNLHKPEPAIEPRKWPTLKSPH